MTSALFVSDLHGQQDRYEKLFRLIESESPAAVFIGGDLLPSTMREFTAMSRPHLDFLHDCLERELHRLRLRLGRRYPRIFVIFGNDDSRYEEATLLDMASSKLLEYIHGQHVEFDRWHVYGYCCIPPSPFLIKDWERYDVSRYVDPGCISPEEGWRSMPQQEHEVKYGTIQKDLEQLVGSDSLESAIFLFHVPPYNCGLDRAALDGQSIDHVPLDLHIGSIAVRRFIESRQPLLTLHGHVHESARLTGAWKEQFGRTVAVSAAHDGPEMAVVRVDLECPDQATREII